MRPDGYRPGPTGPVPVWYGDSAVKVARQVYILLTPGEERVIREEGFVDGLYYDTKGIITAGVGQTGSAIHRGFKVAYREHEDRVRKIIPQFDSLPEYLREELVQSAYRGDITGSPRAVRLFNAMKYQQAAQEFLNNQEYRDSRTPASIKRRIESVSTAILRYAKEQRPDGG